MVNHDSSSSFTELKRYLSEGKPEESIKLIIEKFSNIADGDDLILLSSRINSLKSDIERGILTYDSINIEKNRINITLLGIINEIENVYLIRESSQTLFELGKDIEFRLRNILATAIPSFSFSSKSLRDKKSILILLIRLKEEFQNHISSSINNQLTTGIVEDLIFLQQKKVQSFQQYKDNNLDLFYLLFASRYTFFKNEEKQELKEIVDLLTSESDKIKSEGIIRLLVILLEAAYKSNDYEFILTLTVLWHLERFHLVILLCDNFQNLYPSYHIALIHAAAMIKEKYPFKRVLPIIITLESQHNYKIWIGISYLYFLIWIDNIGRPLLPEISNPNIQRYRKELTIDNFAINAKDYSYKAVAFLNHIHLNEGNEEQSSYRIEGYLLAFSLHLLVIVYNTTNEEFIKAEAKFEELLHFSNSKSRYKELIALIIGMFQLRKSILSNNEDEFHIYLDIASEMVAHEKFSNIDKGINLLLTDFNKQKEEITKKSFWFWKKRFNLLEE